MKNLLGEKHLIFFLRTLYVSSLICSAMVVRNWFWPTENLAKVFYLLGSATNAYGRLEVVDGQQTVQLSCANDKRTENAWHDMDSQIMRLIDGPHSLRIGYVVLGSHIFWEQKSEEGKKVLRAAMCGNSALLKFLGCPDANQEIKIQKWVSRNTYTSASFLCKSPAVE